ncbi:MAG: hypothetical protein KDK78_08895 [Chlamydiia bacterium]|nr:hypothetical protein [Chlamydiia bacterium]
MNSARSRVADALDAKWEALHNGRSTPKRCFIRFDGFRDDILTVVDQRKSPSSFTAIPSIAALGQRISSAAGHSTNLELVSRCSKIGGNAPILCAAMLPAGHEITLCAALGSHGSIDPIFDSLASSCAHCVSIGAPGHSQALEFQDGKIILGQLESISHLNTESIFAQLAPERLVRILDQTDLFASVNWTMLLGMNALWQYLIKHICPQLSERRSKPYLFIDLADPSKRPPTDLKEALKLMRQFETYFHVILGLNCSEARQVAQTFDSAIHCDSMEATLEAAQGLQSRTGLSQILIHATRWAAAASSKDRYAVAGPYCEAPALSTGAGDNFNAGYCTGLLYGLSMEDALLTAVATSGYYVRFCASPAISELSQFLRTWP